MSGAGTTYRLIATDTSKLSPHTGHKVEVMGTLDSSSSSSSYGSGSSAGTSAGTYGRGLHVRHGGHGQHR